MRKPVFDDSGSSAAYFRQLGELAGRLASRGIAVYRHDFHYMAYGSWSLVAGTRDRMIRFTYDGKDSLLSYCDDSVQPRQPGDQVDRRVRTWEGEDPFALVADVLGKAFPDEP